MWSKWQTDAHWPVRYCGWACRRGRRIAPYRHDVEEHGTRDWGMPIVAPWPFGIIVFELTALGAIAFTLGRMIFEAGLMSPVPRALQKAPGVEASVVLEIECPTEARATAAARACQARGGLV